MNSDEPMHLLRKTIPQLCRAYPEHPKRNVTPIIPIKSSIGYHYDSTNIKTAWKNEDLKIIQIPKLWWLHSHYSIPCCAWLPGFEPQSDAPHLHLGQGQQGTGRHHARKPGGLQHAHGRWGVRQRRQGAPAATRLLDGARSGPAPWKVNQIGVPP